MARFSCILICTVLILLPVSALAATYSILELPDWSEGFDELYYVRIEGDGFMTEPWKAEEEKTDEI